MKKPVKKTAPANQPAPAKKAAVRPVTVPAKKAAVAKPVAKPVAKTKTPAPVAAKPAAVKPPVKPAPRAKPATARPVLVSPAPPTKPVARPATPAKTVAKPGIPAKPMPKELPRRKAMAPEQLRGDKRKFYDALINLRGQITSQYRDLSASSLASTKQAGEELADVGSDNFNRDLGLAMLTEDNKKLAQIEEAIERVLHDDYGTCADCGKMIAAARLLAIPFTTVCVDCKARREDNEKYNPGGHLEEEPLFGADGDEPADGGAAEDEEEGDEAPPAKGGKDAKDAKKKVRNEDEPAEEDDDEEA